MQRVSVRLGTIFLMLCLLLPSAQASGLSPMPLNKHMAGPKPKNENYSTTNDFYEDESITVQISTGKYKGVKYTTAHVKIVDPSQLRAVSAEQVRNPSAGFSGNRSTTATGIQICQAVNAVVGMNGDYCVTDDKCQVMMRQCKQIRNRANGAYDVLVIDKNGNFTALRNCTADDYKAYYKAHSKEMYNVFCFGPVLVKNGRTTVGEKYENRNIIAQKKTQRAAIAQIGPLEYMLITADGDSVTYTSGLTVAEFSALCAKLGKEVREEGFQLAYNLDGGNSSALIYKKWAKNKLAYRKLNMPNIGRPLSDMICFFTLVK